MSLNRSEQRLYDYIEANREERHFWEHKVRELQAAHKEPGAAAHRIGLELWRYNVERSGVVPALREVAAREGLRRLSLRTLAEYLLRVWGVPPAPRKPAT